MEERKTQETNREQNAPVEHSSQTAARETASQTDQTPVQKPFTDWASF